MPPGILCGPYQSRLSLVWVSRAVALGVGGIGLHVCSLQVRPPQHRPLSGGLACTKVEWIAAVAILILIPQGGRGGFDVCGLQIRPPQHHPLPGGQALKRGS